ncbi:MAG: NAD(P)H-dependent glycerol-3-phosphate dehydrogenase [Bacteroidales bacterium]|jgi:glycerol-3-phosphate dehydrogenase (NAD(P)+)|nr:NAD(P)H-dependent glycerol-3-phosphate dehydrogenase [Bacteroidales bacterium]
MYQNKEKIAVIGGGSWATAIVKILYDNQLNVYWWVREPEIVESLKEYGHNALYLSSVEFNPRKIHISTRLKAIIAAADTVVLVTPSVYLHKTLSTLDKKDLKGKNIVSAIKGIVPETMQTVSAYMSDTFSIKDDYLCVVSGPSHAEEIADEKLTYLTAGSANPYLAENVQKMFACNYVKISQSPDIEGLEYAVVLKNIYALAGGIFRGADFGDNLLASLNANCVGEMCNFVNTIAPLEKRNFCTSPYAGDFLVTSYSQYSRNRTFGMMIGRGYSVNAVQLEMKMVAEGYYAAKCIHQINAKHQIYIPIAEMVYRILYENAPLKAEMKKILNLIK